MRDLGHCRHRAKQTSYIQYGYRKCGTHARVLAPKFARRKSKNKIRQAEKSEYGKKVRSKVGTKKRSHNPLAKAWERSPRVAIPKSSGSYQINFTLHK